MRGAASAGGRGIGLEHATLPQSHRHGLLTALPPYTNIEDFSHLSKYVRTHFSGDWVAYTAFVHWADSQRLVFPYEPVHVEAWLSLKTSNHLLPMTALPPHTITALGFPQGISTSPLAFMALAVSVKVSEPAPAEGQADDTGEGRGGPQ